MSDEDQIKKRNFTDNLTPIQDSNVNIHRFSNPSSETFTPSTDLNVTEDSLNGLLANYSISALTQNIFFKMTLIDVEEFLNVYHFADKVRFCVPYALCLAIALVYAVIGLGALRRNGVPTVDGGFLQIMMTTRGDTEMERLVVEQGPESVEEISAELKRLQIKLGEVAFGELGEGKRGVRERLAFKTKDEHVVDWKC